MPRERDAVVGEHVRVVLEVVADLGVFLGFEQRLELREARRRGRAGRARRRSRGAAADRPRCPAPPRTRRRRSRAFMYSRLVVSVSNAKSSAAVELRDPVVELRLGGDGFVDARRRGDDRAPSLMRRSRARRRRRAAAGGRRVRRGRRIGRRLAIELLEQRAQLEARVQRAQRVDVGRRRLSSSQRHRQRQVGADGRELARELERARGRRAGFRPPCRSTLAASATSASSVEYWPSHLAAVFGPDLVDARDVVGAVADQREVVDDLLGEHVELRSSRRRDRAPCRSSC